MMASRIAIKVLRPLISTRIQMKPVALRHLCRCKVKSSFLGIDNKELWTIPNMITLSRIVSSPGLAYAIATDMKGIALTGCIVFGISDWLDGYIARTYNQKTALGAFLDPLADKIFIGAVVAGLSAKGLFPLPLAGLILSRDVLLVVASFYMRVKERPEGAPFFDTTSSATFEIVPSELSKINTACQIFLITCCVGNFSLELPLEILVEPMWWITAVTTVGSGLSYLDGSGLKRIPKSGEYKDAHHDHNTL